MMLPRQRQQRHRAEPGFALLVVLWFLVLLSAVAIHLTASARLQIALARNTIATAKAEALADGALVRAAFSLGDPRPELGWVADGTSHIVTMPDGAAAVVAEDENGRINPNLASHDLLVQFFLALDAGRDTADAVSDAIMHQRDGQAATAAAGSPSASPSPTAASAAAAGEPGQATPPLPAAQPGQPQTGGRTAFESVDDLGLLPAMPAELLAAARPYLTVYTKSPTPDPTHASELVRRVLATVPVPPGQANAGQAASPPGIPAAAAPQIFHATIRARTTSGARFGRETVIRIDSMQPKGYAVLWWRRFDRESEVGPVATDQ